MYIFLSKNIYYEFNAQGLVDRELSTIIRAPFPAFAPTTQTTDAPGHDIPNSSTCKSPGKSWWSRILVVVVSQRLGNSTVVLELKKRRGGSNAQKRRNISYNSWFFLVYHYYTANQQPVLFLDIPAYCVTQHWTGSIQIGQKIMISRIPTGQPVAGFDKESVKKQAHKCKKRGEGDFRSCDRIIHHERSYIQLIMRCATTY